MASDSELSEFGSQEDDDVSEIKKTTLKLITMKELLENFDTQKLRFRDSKEEILKYKIDLYTKKKNEANKLIGDRNALIDIWSKTLESRGFLTPDNSYQLLNERVPDWITYQSQMITYTALIDSLKKQQKDFKNNWKSQFEELKSSLKEFQSNYLGREEVQDKIAQVIYAFFENWAYVKSDYLNFLYLGDPGTGKTKLASYVAKVLSLSGILAKDNVIVVGKEDFVGQYVGTTAPKTLGLLNNSLESVLFLDEAYNLTTRDNQGKFDSYSLEAITTIVGFLDKNRGLLSFHAAGYFKQMIEDFLGSNPGMSRRFPYRFTLTNFSPKELVDIFQKLLRDQYDTDPSIISDDGLNYLKTIITYGGKALFPFQAGSMENLASIVSRRIYSLGLKESEALFGPCSMRDAYVEYVQSFFIGQNPSIDIDDKIELSDKQCSVEFASFPQRFETEKEQSPKKTRRGKK